MWKLDLLERLGPTIMQPIPDNFNLFDGALKVSPGSGSPSGDTDTYTSDFVSDLVSKKMRMNFQTLLDKHPNGIWCSELPELPDLYKKEFAVILEYTNLGFMSVMQMASSLPDVFHCVKVDGTDCKLFDARKILPPEYARYDMTNNVHGFCSLC